MLDADRHRAQTALAQRARDRDVEIAVEAVALVEPADRDECVARRRLAVPLDRVARAIGHLIEVPEVLRPQAPRTGDTRARAERRIEHREQVALQLHGWVELQHQSAARGTQESVASRTLAEVAIGVDDPDVLARGQA